MLIHDDIKYTNSSIKVGSFAFYKTDGWFSPKIIRDLQRKKYAKDKDKWIAEANHVAYCIGRDALLREQVLPKTVFRKATEVKDRKLIAIVTPVWFAFDDDSLERDKLLASKKEIIREERLIKTQWYGLLQIFGILYVYFRHQLGLPFKKNPLRDGTICTEDAMRYKLDLEDFYNILDITNDMIIDINAIFPALLLKLFIKSPYYYVHRVN